MTDHDNQATPAPPCPSRSREALARDFGPNAWLVMDLLDTYRKDPQAGLPRLARLFPGPRRPPGRPAGRRASPAGARAPRPAPAGPPSAPRGGRVPPTGPALRVAQNMEASLGIPTASSVR